jgi:hypothetical protein
MVPAMDRREGRSPTPCGPSEGPQPDLTQVSAA